MRRPFLFSLVLTLTLFCSFAPEAAAGDSRWLSLTPADRAIVDRLAADIYQTEIDGAMRQQIEAQTSRAYANGQPVDQARFRAQRREDWRAMSPSQRAALRSAKYPTWRNLADGQRAGFRRRAMDALSVPFGRQPPPRAIGRSL